MGVRAIEEKEIPFRGKQYGDNDIEELWVVNRSSAVVTDRIGLVPYGMFPQIPTEHLQQFFPTAT